MKNLIKTAAITGMLSGLMLAAGCEETAIYSVGGNISGLDTAATFDNNGDLQSMGGNGDFVFRALYSDNTAYNVTVFRQPSWQTCAISNTSGTISAANVTDIVITCTDNGPAEPEPRPKPKALNDTGLTLCGNVSGNNSLNCSATGAGISVAGIDGDGYMVPAGQDAFYGRDATHNDNSDGQAGFSYTKLDSSGQALPASATRWDCVQDNVTGLTWEVKTDDDGLRDKDWSYTWYNSSNSNDGGDHGIGDTGLRTTTGLEFKEPNSLSYNKFGSDECATNNRCDTEKYVADVNAAGLCGAGSAWRMPTRTELRSLTSTHRDKPAIDIDYFPNTVSPIVTTAANWYFTASPVALNRKQAWVVGFDGGVQEHRSNKDSPQPVRLVRASQ